MHQYLFFIGDFPVRSYGLVLSLSIILATGVAYFLAKQDGRWHDHIVNLGICCGISGIIGARLWDVFFFDFAYYGNHLDEIFYVWQGGMAIQGGIVFGVIAGIIYARRHYSRSGYRPLRQSFKRRRFRSADRQQFRYHLSRYDACLPHVRRPAALAG